METARVDVRRLQMLNDRINQTIDALHQVRLSVHGMGNPIGIGANVNGTNSPFATAGFPGAFAQGLPFGAQGAVQGLFGQTGFGQTGFGQTGGFPMNTLGYGLQGQLPWVQQQAWGGLPFGGLNQNLGQNAGFAHTSPEAVDFFTRRGIGQIDPFVASRIAQTFPFVQWGYSPLASGYSPFGSAAF